AALLLEFADLVGDVTFDDRRIPRRGFERARGDVLRHAVHLLAELARALHGRPGGCKALVREASASQGVAGEELSRFGRGGLLGPKRKDRKSTRLNSSHGSI